MNKSYYCFLYLTYILIWIIKITSLYLQNDYTRTNSPSIIARKLGQINNYDDMSGMTRQEWLEKYKQLKKEGFGNLK